MREEYYLSYPYQYAAISTYGREEEEQGGGGRGGGGGGSGRGGAGRGGVNQKREDTYTNVITECTNIVYVCGFYLYTAPLTIICRS